MTARLWDDGVAWRTAIVSVDLGSPAFSAISLDFASRLVLRTQTGGAEDELVAHYIQAATEFGERLRGEHITPKTLALILDQFPAGHIELPDAPVREILSIAYIDGAGAPQTFDNVSPHTWTYIAAGRFSRARVEPAVGEAWPATQARPDAVTVTFTVGYDREDDVPAMIRQAIAVTVGEFYKNPDLSNPDGAMANVLGLAQFWPRRW